MLISKIPKAKLIILALICANIIWGASFPIYKWSLKTTPPFTFAFLRFFLGALILLPFVLHKLKIEKKDILYLSFFSILSISISIPLLLFGLKLAPSINAPIIASASPIFLIMASFFYLKEKIKKQIIYGTLISLLGISVILFRPLFDQGVNIAILGNLLLTFSVLFSIICTVYFKKILLRYDSVTLAFWSFILGSLPLLPFVIYENQPPGTNISYLSLNSFLGLGYGVIFSTVIASTLYFWGLKQMRASEVGIFAYIDPLATILVAVPLLHERITPLYLGGTVLVFLGIFIAEKRLNWHPLHRLT